MELQTAVLQQTLRSRKFRRFRVWMTAALLVEMGTDYTALPCGYATQFPGCRNKKRASWPSSRLSYYAHGLVSLCPFSVPLVALQYRSGAERSVPLGGREEQRRASSKPCAVNAPISPPQETGRRYDDPINFDAKEMLVQTTVACTIPPSTAVGQRKKQIPQASRLVMGRMWGRYGVSLLCLLPEKMTRKLFLVFRHASPTRTFGSWLKA